MFFFLPQYTAKVVQQVLPWCRAAQLIEFLIAITIMDATITQSFKAAITKINKQLKMPTCIILCA